MNPKLPYSAIFGVGLCLAALGGCAKRIVPATESDWLQADDRIAAGKSGTVSDPQAGIIYRLLSAELAGQRGRTEEALENYLAAAKMGRDPAVAERATQIALFLKKDDKALEAVQLWLERGTNNPAARRAAVMVYLKAGQTTEAVEQLAALLKSDVDVEETLLDLVRALDKEVPRDAAYALMNQVIARFPALPEAHLAYALFAANKADNRLALEHVGIAVNAQPDSSKARVLQAQVLTQMGDSDQARSVLAGALKQDPKNTRLRLIYSQFLVKAGKSQAAEREIKTVLQQDPRNGDARFGLATIQLESNRLRQAKDTLMGLINTQRWQRQAYFYLGLIEAKAGAPAKALEWLDRVNDGPLVFDAQLNSVSALNALNRLPEARSRLAELRERFPAEALRLYLMEGDLLTKQKDYLAAFDVLSNALEELPGHPDLLYTRALIAEQLDRLDVLEADLRAVLDKKPDDVNALNALGYTLVDRTDRYEEAQVYLQKAISLRPDDPAIMDSFGWLQYKLGHLDQAIDYLQKAYIQVADPEIGAHLGEVLWESGRLVQAKRVWREIARKEPSHRKVQEIRRRYPKAFD